MTVTADVDTVAPQQVVLAGGGRVSRRRYPDVLGLVWVVVAGALAMLRPLLHGVQLGPYDQLSLYGLSKQTGMPVHPTIAYDQIRELIPWTTLVWNQVHQGHLPLWNPYSALGMPLAFNWQSAPFGLPALVGYLFPVHLAYTAGVMTTMVVAGTGTYVLARVLGCSVLGSALAATVFQLSGAFVLYLGWPIASVMSWVGWLFAFAILLVRGRHRVRDGVLLSTTIALAIYAGQIDVLLVLTAGAAVFVVALLVGRARSPQTTNTIRRSVIDVGLATLGGVALGAPLLLPGAQLALLSVRSASGGSWLGGHSAVPISEVGQFLFSGWNGYPRTWDALFLGTTVVVLAAAGLTRHKSRPEIVALAVLAIIMAAFAFVPPVVWLLGKLPGFGAVRPTRALTLLVFAVALLAGFGLDVVVHARRRALGWLGGAFAAIGLALAGLWLFSGSGLPSEAMAVRSSAFAWTALEICVGLGAIALLFVSQRKLRQEGTGARVARNLVRVAFLACSTVVLMVAHASLWSSSSSGLVPTSAELALHDAIGSSVVGFGQTLCKDVYSIPALGIVENTNINLQVHEMAVYDPMIPISYFVSWPHNSGTSIHGAGYPGISTFCPAFLSASVARLYGVEYVLEPRGHPGPAGTVFDRNIGDEVLYRVPGAALATLVPSGVAGPLPPINESGRPVPVSFPDPTSWRVRTDAATAQVLRLRLTNVPGWHASIDGRPLQLHTFAGVMMQARIPPGPHLIELHYWPNSFNVGLVLAATALIAIGCIIVVGVGRRSRSRVLQETVT